MSTISTVIRDQVILRAKQRCEYCGLSQLGQEATFHIDHVVPRSANGETEIGNLALACVSCSLRKWANQTGIDPDTGLPQSLFHPRTMVWSEHFEWNYEILQGITPTGRATIQALGLNRPTILFIRIEEMERGRHPPSDG